MSGPTHPTSRTQSLGVPKFQLNPRPASALRRAHGTGSPRVHPGPRPRGRTWPSGAWLVEPQAASDLRISSGLGDAGRVWGSQRPRMDSDPAPTPGAGTGGRGEGARAPAFSWFGPLGDRPLLGPGPCATSAASAWPAPPPAPPGAQAPVPRRAPQSASPRPPRQPRPDQRPRSPGRAARPVTRARRT